MQSEEWGTGEPAAAITNPIFEWGNAQDFRNSVFTFHSALCTLHSALMQTFPRICLVRHGQTAWSLSGRHTGRTDIPLTEKGEDEAREVGMRLAGKTFAQVWTSPSSRARRTAEIAGFASVATVDPDLAEWDYGDYEGLLSSEIHAKNPTWDIFRDGVPHGETLADVGARADRVVARLRAVNNEVLIFSSGHFLRALAARWVGLDAAGGRFFLLSTASLSILSYEHSLEQPAIALWNET
jgi:probable phosphoglycerate mutase